MTNSQRLAAAYRGLILTIALLCCSVGTYGLFVTAGVIGTPASVPVALPLEHLLPGWLGEAVSNFLYVGVLLLFQWLFLRPRRAWAVQLAATGRPMKSAVAAAAFMAMLLTVGCLAVILELADGWYDQERQRTEELAAGTPPPPPALVSDGANGREFSQPGNFGMVLEQASVPDREDGNRGQSGHENAPGPSGNVGEHEEKTVNDTLIPLSFGAMAALWIVWALVFFDYWRGGDRYTQLGKMVRGLLTGSILESQVAVWVFAWNPHNKNCYCTRGSYTGLVFGLTVIGWCFGPGVALLFMREKYRREKLHEMLHELRDSRTDVRDVGAGRETAPVGYQESS